MSARRDAIFALALWKVRGTFPAQALRGATDHAFALELVGAVLRHKASLEWILRHCMARFPDGELWAALMVGAAQLLTLPTVAEYAAIAETVEATKPIGRGAAKLVNAVLRRIQRERADLLAALKQQPEHLQWDVPRALWQRWSATFGVEATRALAKALATPPRTCVRPLPPNPPPPACEPHPCDPTGTFRVPHGQRVEGLAGYAEGTFVVQDAATRFAVELLDVHPGQTVLDGCAAPGGKTAQIAARLQGQGTLLANEVSSTRLFRLHDTLTRCGFAEQVTVISRDLTQPWPEAPRFDRILLDVPCSNTGVFGRRPDARWTWSPQTLAQLVKTQAALLEQASQFLAPGGVLVYSTCSIEPEEDDAQIAAFLARHPEFERVDSHLELPTETHDGAYAAALRLR